VRQRWNHLLLVALLLGHLLLLSNHEGARGSPVETLMLATLGPVLHAVVASAEGMEELFASFRLAGALREENRRLRRENEKLRRQVVRLQGVEEELSQVTGLLDYVRFDAGEPFVANVVYIDRDSWLRTLVIYTGTERAEVNQAVVTARGLVGRIITTTDRYAKVLLVTDRSATVSAMIERTRRRGLVRGAEAGLLLDNIPQLADVQIGDRVVTAGIDGVFPRGIPIGEVEKVEAGAGLFHRISMTPAIDLDLLDQVYVLTEKVVPTEIREQLEEGEEGGS